MKSQKRDSEKRIFHHGYLAGARGKSLSECPYTAFGSDKRHQWTSGWREGRSDQWSGKASIAGLHKIVL